MQSDFETDMLLSIMIEWGVSEDNSEQRYLKTPLIRLHKGTSRTPLSSYDRDMVTFGGILGPKYEI